MGIAILLGPRVPVTVNARIAPWLSQGICWSLKSPSSEILCRFVDVGDDCLAALRPWYANCAPFDSAAGRG